MLRVGETFVYGLSTEMARNVMTACSNIGVDPMRVRTTDMGFIMPDEVVDELERMARQGWAEREAVF